MTELERELLKRLIVANDWLADKGIPAEHIEMVRIREAIAQGLKAEANIA